ncbi:hypothetical protein B0H13DRAFT_2268485 [Mycena leptocephala]|nr:hypothetical protein B0H13DRAFT_2268485 [Mycena leptocephala]
MSSFNILEFFQLKAGRRVIVNKLNSTYGTHYAHYNTHVWCIKDTGNTIIPADLLCSVQSIAVPPATNSLLINTLTLDAMTFFVLPGSPDSDTYNNQLPDEHTSMVYGVGRVTGSPQTLDDGHVPQPNTAIQCYGLCHELGPTGTLCLKVYSTALNISTSGSAPSDDTSGSPGSTTSAPVTPSKRRKFDPPSLPPSADSPDSPLASSTSTPSSNVATSMASVPDPNARIGPMHYSQLFQQYPQCMPPPTGVYVPPFHPQQVNRSAANPYSYPMTQVPPVMNSSSASTSQSNTSTSVQPSSSSPPVPAAHSIQRNPQPATPSGSTSGGSSATVSTPSTVQGPNLRPRK